MPSKVDICNRALSVIGTRSTITSMSEASPEARACTLHFESMCRALLRLTPWSFARATVPAALIAAAPGTPENQAGVAPLPLVPIGAANLAGSSPTQIVPWQYEYAWPQDCIRLRQVKYPYDQPQSSTNVVSFRPWGRLVSGTYPEMPQISLENCVTYQIALDKDASGNQIRVILSNIENALIVYTALVDDPNLWDDEFSEAFVYALASQLVGSLIGDKQMDKDLWIKAQMLATTARAADGNEQPLSPNHTPDWILARGWIPIGGMLPYPVDDGDYGYQLPI